MLIPFPPRVVRGGLTWQVQTTRRLLESREARRAERVWLTRQSHGELDESRIVDGIAGDRAVYRRRAEKPPEVGAPQLKPKLLRFVIDCSGSMYYFNGHDRRLERTLQVRVGHSPLLPPPPISTPPSRQPSPPPSPSPSPPQTAVMIFEAFAGFEHKYRYAMVGHSGDTPCHPLVEYGLPPNNEKERLKVVQRMMAHTQFCMSGDHTLEATREAIEEAASHLEHVDEAFVFVLSDANLERYGIRPKAFADALSSHPKVHAHACFLASLGGAAERLRDALPEGKASVCLDASELPQAFRSMLAASALKEEK